MPRAPLHTGQAYDPPYASSSSYAEAGPSSNSGYTAESPAPSGASPGSTTKSGSTSKRPKTGCLTCRLRKKRCDEQKPQCATCERLGIDCLGYEKANPDWLKGRDNKLKAKQDLKERIKVNRATRIKEAKEEDGDSPSRDGDGWERRLSSPYQEFQPIHPAQPVQSVSNNVVIDPYLQSDIQPAYLTSLDPAYIPPQAQPPWLAPMSNQPLVPIQPLITPTDSLAPFASYNAPETGFEEVWNLIFGNQPPGFSMNATPGFAMPLSFPPPSPLSDQSLLSLYSSPLPDPSSALTTTSDPQINPTPDYTYLHHYLNVVLPLQYRFVIKAMGDLIAPLAMSNPDIFKAASALAALHRSANRAKDVPTLSWSNIPDERRYEDVETIFANSMHKETIDRLRFVTPEQLTDEGVVLPILFAMSFYLFLGGTSRHWTELLNLSRRCLSAAFAASPEIAVLVNGKKEDVSGGKNGNRSPWQRYRPLICAMVWMDIVGSVTLNQASSILPVYRGLLAQAPARFGEKRRNKLHMDRVMGCDDTTFLAIAETVGLSEWRDAQEDAECLSMKELILRASAIEQLLEERSWRENTLSTALATEIEDDTTDNANQEHMGNEPIGIATVMSEIFFGAAKVLLGSVIHGPNPRVAEILSAVNNTAEALRRLDTQHPSSDVNRALILPITIAGSHCDDPIQQAFFRSRFATLGAEAEAFGNSKQALQLLEEVWRRRRDGERRVGWRRVMRDLGWEEGILLI